MKRLTSRIVVAILFFFVVALVVAGTALAQDTSWCISADGSPVGCAEITIAPAGTIGDFYVADVPLAMAQNPGRLILPPGTVKVTIKNIVSSEPGFGSLFIYNDATATLTLTAGKVSSKTVTATKKFIRGTLALTCDVRGAVAGVDDVNCAVTIDGTPQPDLVAPGTVHNYVLDPGAHSVMVTLVGGSAIYWTPDSSTAKTTITAGRTTALKPRFDKKGHLGIAMDQLGTVGDIYVDGVLLATQAVSADTWVTPNKSHKIEIKVITDPAANGLYYFKDASTTATLTPGQEKTVIVKLTKVWLKGFIDLTCNITNYQGGMSCSPVLDGVQMPLVPVGTVTTYTVDPGAHKLVVTIDPAAEFGSTPKTFNASVIGGKTYKANATLTAIVPTFKLTVTNNSYTVICNLFVTPIGIPRGTDLVISLGKGASKTFTVGKGTYDLYAENCEDNPLGSLGSVTMTGPFTWTVNGPPATTGKPITLRMINQAGMDICLIQIVPSNIGVDGTQNWLRPGQVLSNGQNQDMLITEGDWDIYARSCDNHVYWARSHISFVGGNWNYTFYGVAAYHADTPNHIYSMPK